MRMDTRWTLVPLAKIKACKERGSPIRHEKTSSCTPSNEVPPSPGAVDQTAYVPEQRVGVTDVQLVITKLSDEAAG